MTKKRILIVEDDAALARVLSDNLTFDGFEDVRGTPFPRSIAFAGAGSVALQYTDLRLGEQPDAALFTPQAPPGVPVEQINPLP